MLLSWPLLSTNFAPTGGRALTTPEYVNGSVAPAEGSRQGNDTPSGTHRRPSLLSKLSLAPVTSLYLTNAFVTSVMSRRPETDNDIIGFRRDLRSKTSSKGDSTWGQICSLIPKTTEPRLQSKDLEKMGLGATLSDQPLDRENFRTLSIHLHYRLEVVEQSTNLFVKLWFAVGGLQNRHQKSMVHSVEGLGLI